MVVGELNHSFMKRKDENVVVGDVADLFLARVSHTHVLVAHVTSHVIDRVTTYLYTCVIFTHHWSIG